jgi:hypothetical protein
VEKNDAIISGQPKIGFDAGAIFKRRGKGDEAVFGESRAGVEPAMSEPKPARVERVRL